MFDLGDRVALVTGAGQGLGLAIAEALAEAGAHVILNGRQTARLEAAEAQILGKGGTASPLAFDIADPREVAAAFDRIGAAFGGLDILVGNVGIRHRVPLAEISAEDFHRVLEVNLTAGFHLAKSAVPLRSRAAAVRHHGDVDRGRARPGNDAAYIAAKGGLAGFVRALAVEFGPRGITTNAIAPGYFATETNAAMVDDPEVEGFVKRRIPLQRWGKPSEVAGAAVFLASDAASYVNGHVLTVDGGLSASF
jgi:gluconate 5-dehydrogenase